MPKKKPSLYELGKVKGEIVYSEKHSVRMYYFNHIMNWVYKILALVLTSEGAVKLLLKLISN